MRPDPAPSVSVIISTRDRPEQLLQCLAALCIASVACRDVAIEVLVIENGSAVARRIAARDLASVAPVGTRLISLDGGSLSVARNLGMAEARGELLAFVDDDCLVDPGWLVDVMRHWRAMPSGFLMGGRVRLADEADLPFTIKDVDEAGVFHPGVHPGGFILGCNFIVPRATAQRIGQFDTRFGAGARFRAGEDTDFIIRAHGLGFPVHYVPDMVVLHRHGRRYFGEINKLNAAYAHANGAILAKHLFRHPWLARHLMWTIRSSLRESFGGPAFDMQIGLAWKSVTRGQLRGFLAFITSSFRRKQDTP